MPTSLIFWVLMLIWLVFGLFGSAINQPWTGYASTILLFVLFALLGWKVFGAAVKNG